jgi:hypothetical protein
VVLDLPEESIANDEGTVDNGADFQVHLSSAWTQAESDAAAAAPIARNNRCFDQGTEDIGNRRAERGLVNGWLQALGNEIEQVEYRH